MSARGRRPRTRKRRRTRHDADKNRGMPETTSSSAAFIDAIKAGEFERVKAMVSADPTLIDARSRTGDSAILTAVYHHQKEIVNLLVARGAALSLFEACAAGEIERVERTLDRVDHQYLQRRRLDAAAPRGVLRSSEDHRAAARAGRRRRGALTQSERQHAAARGAGRQPQARRGAAHRARRRRQRRRRQRLVPAASRGRQQQSRRDQRADRAGRRRGGGQRRRADAALDRAGKKSPRSGGAPAQIWSH